MSENTPAYDENEDRQLAPIEPAHYAPAPVDQFTDERVTLIRETVAKGAPDDVFRAMIDIARTRGLDPMAKQIGVAKFDSRGGGGYQIYMPIDGYRAVAGDHPDFAGKDRPEYGPVIGQTPLGKSIPEWCAVTVYRLVKGQRMPFTAEVWWEEFYGGEKNFSWNKMPRVMLAKVAEAHALRMAFTRSLSGTYTPEEMDQAAVDIEGRVVNAGTGEIRAQSRQTAPQRTQPAIEASVDHDAHQAAMKRLHAVARQHGIHHDALHAWAIEAAKRNGRQISSMNEQSPSWLHATADRIEADPKAAQEYAKVSIKERTQARIQEAPQVDDLDAAMDAALNAATPADAEIEDAEYTEYQDQPTERKRTDTQGKALWKISGANRDVLAGWCAEYGVSSDRDLTEEQAAALIEKYGS